MLTFKIRAVSAVVLSLGVLAGCMNPGGGATTGFHGKVDRLNMVDPNRNFSRVYRDYPSMDARFARNGTWKSLRAVRQLAIGQSQAQVRRTLGKPVSVMESENWNYVLHLPLDRDNRLVCQFRVYFDENNRLTGTLWRRPQCAEVATGRFQ